MYRHTEHASRPVAPRRRRQPATVLTLAALAGLAACADSATAPASRDARGSRPAAQISDAAHSLGNRHFAWLPPVVPAAPAPNGTADGSLQPVVVLCEWSGSACGATLGTFSRLAGTANARIKLTGSQSYALTLPSIRLGMVAGRSYRASVSIFRTPVGSIDIMAVATAAEAAAVDRSQFVPVVVGTQADLVFRLERGVVYLVEPTGTTVTSLDDAVTLAVPAGAIADEIGATIQAVTPAGAPGTVLGAYDIGPAATHLALPAQLTIGMGQLPAGVDPSLVAIYQLVGGAWTAVAGSAVDAARNEVGAPISDFGSYAVIATAPAADPTIFDFVTAGNAPMCGFKGPVTYCWGSGQEGSLGDGTAQTPYDGYPVQVAGGIVFKQVDSDVHTCGLDAAGRAYCWGTNQSAGLGIGFEGGWSVVPAPVVGGLTFKSISVGDWSTCGVTTAGDIYCWGEAGALNGDVIANGTWGPTHVAPHPVGGGTSFTEVSVGHGHACALSTSQAVYCWGRNANGESGLAQSVITHSVPTQITPAGMTFKSVSAGQIHSCAVTTAGVGYCWGYNGSGELGLGYEGDWWNYYTWGTGGPVVGHTWETIHAGVGFSCGITTAHEAYCWGNNDPGKLGTGSTTPNISGTPLPVAGLSGVTTIGTGYHVACAIAQSGPEGPGAYCWGTGFKGTAGPWVDPTPHRVLGQ